MRMERYLRRKRKGRYIRFLAAWQIMFTLLMLHITSPSYALLADREKVPAEKFAAAFIFPETVDQTLKKAVEAADEAAKQGRYAVEASEGCKEGDLQHAVEAEQAVFLSGRAAEIAQDAVDELKQYLARAEEEVHKAKKEVDERLIREAVENGRKLDEKKLKSEQERGSNVQSAERLYKHIEQALIKANKEVARTDKHVTSGKQAAIRCDQLIEWKEKQPKAEKTKPEVQEKQSRQKGTEMLETQHNPDEIENQELPAEESQKRRKQVKQPGSTTDEEQNNSDGTGDGKSTEQDDDTNEGQRGQQTSQAENRPDEAGTTKAGVKHDGDSEKVDQ